MRPPATARRGAACLDQPQTRARARGLDRDRHRGRPADVHTRERPPRERQPAAGLDVADQRLAHLAVGEAGKPGAAGACIELDVGLEPFAQPVAVGHLLPDLVGRGGSSTSW